LEIKLKNRNKSILFITLVFLLVLPLTYAENYGTGNYGADQYNVGETVAAVNNNGGGGSSGGKGGKSVTNTTVVEYKESECYKDADCRISEYCFQGTCSVAECFDDLSCTEDEVCHQHMCVKLFDVEIKEFESPIKLGDFFDFTYFIKGMANFNDDVIINFKIEKDGTIVTSGQDVIYLASFEEKTKTTKLFLPSTVASGVYTFSVKVNYGSYKAESFRTIEIIVGEEGNAEIMLLPERRSLIESAIEWSRDQLQPFISQYTYIILGIIEIIVLSIIVIVLIKRQTNKSKRMKKKRGKKKIRKKKIKRTYRNIILNNLRRIKK
jgi:hypothetical protein